MNVREYWQGVVELELSYVAHMVYWALQRGFVKERDDWRELVDVPYALDEVAQLYVENVLCIGGVKLFAVQCDETWYAFYFATNALSVKLLHKERFGTCEAVVQAERLEYSSVLVEGKGRDVDFLTLKKELGSFPAFVGLMQAGVMVLHQ